MIRILATIGVIAIGLLQACAGTSPRSAEDFAAISRSNLESSTLEDLTGFDPVLDWSRLLWIEQALADDAARGKPLFLKGVEQLSPEEIEVLGRGSATQIFLPDLRHLDLPTVSVLLSLKQEDERGHGKDLHLDGIHKLEPAVARALVAYRPYRLSLSGLEELDVSLAAILAEAEGELRLNGVRQLSLDVAQTLSSWDGWGEQIFLSLRGLRELDPELAGELAACRGWGLDLSGLENLRPETASALGELDNPYLALDGLRVIETATARVISSWRRKFLSLDGLRRLDAESRRLIDQGTEAVSYRGLRP